MPDFAGMTNGSLYDVRMSVHDTIESLITRLQLQQHPEGGWYRETFRSSVQMSIDALPKGYDRSAADSRCAMTSIMFLLPKGIRTRWHRVRSEELFVHHSGDDVQLLVHEPAERPDGDAAIEMLGQSAEAQFQVVVPSMWWQAAETVQGPHGFALLGCVVSPGFEFADFQLTKD